MGATSSIVDEYVRTLDRRLRGPARLRSDLVHEVRDSLADAVEAYTRAGMDGRAAQRRAVAEFGDPAELAPAYQRELAAAALRVLSVRVVAVAGVLTVAGDLTWRGSSWSDGPRPPAGYLLLSASLNWLWVGAALLAVASWALLGWDARRGGTGPVGLIRSLGYGLTGTLLLAGAAGAGIYAWSLGLWEAALTWPPMIVGLLVIGTGYVWLGRAAHSWLAATR
ncbi:permease prefix domain 1-containing protein [Micromonospora sp. CPCC 206060]|uniref:permease prefix domain 1-containing protein n=1 Tax=Micromonospora sp. CPCC 206060 TaxID=3122406 RepID=UPI002FF185A8